MSSYNCSKIKRNLNNLNFWPNGTDVCFYPDSIRYRLTIEVNYTVYAVFV